MKTPATRAARRAGSVAGLGGALGISAILSCAVVNASAGHPGNHPVKVGVRNAPAMKLRTSPDEKVNTSGTQGELRRSAVQGIFESAVQCDSTSLKAKVPCDTQSPEATPQLKPK